MKRKYENRIRKLESRLDKSEKKNKILSNILDEFKTKLKSKLAYEIKCSTDSTKLISKKSNEKSKIENEKTDKNENLKKINVYELTLSLTGNTAASIYALENPVYKKWEPSSILTIRIRNENLENKKNDLFADYGFETKSHLFIAGFFSRLRQDSLFSDLTTEIEVSKIKGIGRKLLFELLKYIVRKEKLALNYPIVLESDGGDRNELLVKYYQTLGFNVHQLKKPNPELGNRVLMFSTFEQFSKSFKTLNF